MFEVNIYCKHAGGNMFLVYYAPSNINCVTITRLIFCGTTNVIAVFPDLSSELKK